MGSSCIQNAGLYPSSTYLKEMSAAPTPTSRDTAAHFAKDKFVCLPLRRFLTENSGLSEEATGVIKASWRSSTEQRYQDHMHKFSHYCIQNNINPAQADFKIGIKYLTQYFYTGVGYCSVNTAWSVLSSILKPENGTWCGRDPFVCRLLKGVFTPILGMSQCTLGT